jgi:uncharacterized protein with NRDE domain
MLRLDPGAAVPLILAAVRDEFADRPWDPPGPHWPDQAPGVIGGRDRLAGGTWLAVRAHQAPAVAALLNGVRLPLPAAGHRPSRGALALQALTGAARLTAADLAGYDGFHLILADTTQVTIWTWDGVRVERTQLAPGNHIIVNDGMNTEADPLVPHFRPLLAETAGQSWESWQHLLRGDGLPPDDPRALIVRKEFAHRWYGSSSASLIGLSAGGGVRFSFTATPQRPAWYDVAMPEN